MAGKVIPLAGRSERTLQPPSNVEAEQIVLGAILASNALLEQISDTLHPKHFFDPMHARVYAECARRIVAGQNVSAVTLSAWFNADEAAEQVGGSAYLAPLVQTYGMIDPDIRQFAEAIIDCWIRREAIDACRLLAMTAYNGSTAITTEIHKVTETLASLDPLIGTQQNAMSFDDALARAISRAREMKAKGGRGDIRIDMFPRTMRRLAVMAEELTILAGQPGEGKSALAFQWMVEAAISMRDRLAAGEPIEQVGGIIAFSLEMTTEGITARTLSAMTGIQANYILRGWLSEAEFDQLEAARVQLQGLPIWLDAVGGLSPAAMRMKLRAKRKRFGGKIAMIIIDHLQLAEPDQEFAKAGGAWATGKVADAVMAFKKEFNTHVLALSQIDIKELAKREDKRPTKADLRWSANFAQNADNILFIHRPEMYLPKTEPTQGAYEPPADYELRVQRWKETKEKYAGKAELICEKARGADSGWVVHLLFDGRTTSFSEDTEYE